MRLSSCKTTAQSRADEAFAKLPAGAIESLLRPENKESLKAVLTYHVVPGRVASGEVEKIEFRTDRQGLFVEHQCAGRKVTVTVNKAQAVQTDIMASNGVIHVIDSVILPQ